MKTFNVMHAARRWRRHLVACARDTNKNKKTSRK
jgi:hypothetical protein